MRTLLFAFALLCAMLLAVDSFAEEQVTLKGVPIYMETDFNFPAIIKDGAGKTIFSLEDIYLCSGSFDYTFTIGEKDCVLVGGNCGGTICGDDGMYVVVCYDGNNYTLSEMFEAGPLEKADSDGTRATFDFSLSVGYPPLSISYDGKGFTRDEKVVIATEEDYKEYYEFYKSECKTGSSLCEGKENAIPVLQRTMTRFLQKGVSDANFDDICHNACISKSHIPYKEFMKQLKMGTGRLPAKR